MDIDIYFDPAAHKHGFTEEDIKMAFDNAELDGFVDEDDPDAENKNLLIGFDTKANLIEVFYNVIADGSIKVFHAMKCRRQFLELLTDRRKK